MSEIKAQLYAGNPLSVTDDELDRLRRQPTVGMSLEMELTQSGGSGKGWSKPSLYRVYRPALRGAGEKTLAENVTEEIARLIVDGARYLHLVAAAIRELREQAPEAEKAKWRADGAKAVTPPAGSQGDPPPGSPEDVEAHPWKAGGLDEAAFRQNAKDAHELACVTAVLDAHNVPTKMSSGVPFTVHGRVAAALEQPKG